MSWVSREGKIARTAVRRADATEEQIGSGPAGTKGICCANCGTFFSCGALESPCWCDTVKLSPAALANLRARYVDCLCPRCLVAAEVVRLEP